MQSVPQKPCSLFGFSAQIPLTLALSPREREQHRPSVERNGMLGLAQQLAMILPLPLGGEGNERTLLNLRRCKCFRALFLSSDPNFIILLVASATAATYSAAA